MNPAWLSAIATAVVMLLGVGGLIWRDGRRNGRLDAILERLADVAEDHEERIRELEIPGSVYARSRRRPRPPGHAAQWHG